MSDLKLEYRDIAGFPGYRIGNDGSVWSLRRKNGKLGDVWKVLKPIALTTGYRCVGLYLRNVSQQRIIHRLVLEAFVGPCPPGMEGCHNDGDQGNNHLGNLRWDTHKGNTSDRARHGTNRFGERHPRSKLTDAAVVVVLGELSQGLALTEIGKRHGVSFRTIWDVAQGKSWRHIQRPAMVYGWKARSSIRAAFAPVCSDGYQFPGGS